MVRIIEVADDEHAKAVAQHILSFGDVEVGTMTGSNGRIAFYIADDADVDPLPAPILDIDRGGVDPNNPATQTRRQRLGTPDVNYE